MANFLFVCSRNRWRSLTAETIFRNNGEHDVRSAGTEPSARVRVSEKLLLWADHIFVMEKKHLRRLNENFGTALRGKEIVVLEIPDDYQYMDIDLIEMLTDAMKSYLQPGRY